jgi:hypothetical protein
MKKLLGTFVALAVLAATVPALAGTRAVAREGKPEARLAALKYFVDVHDRGNRTFPAQISKEDFAKFSAAFEEACRAEGVVLLRVHTNLEAGRAYCLTAAPSAEAVRRAHERVGLPYDVITEVATVTPGDLFP